MLQDQFTAIRPSYFDRRGVCDMFPLCFRPGHTTIYELDADGLETQVLCLCSFHSGTEETEILPFEKLNKTMVKEAIVALAKEQPSFNTEDVVRKLIELGYERQVNWADMSEIRSLMTFVIVSASMINHYSNSWGS